MLRVYVDVDVDVDVNHSHLGEYGNTGNPRGWMKVVAMSKLDRGTLRASGVVKERSHIDIDIKLHISLTFQALGENVTTPWGRSKVSLVSMLSQLGAAGEIARAG
jgi:hypothetical protein